MSISRLLFSSLLPATALAAVLSYASVSRADALPPDGCQGAAGATCENAGPNNDEPGVCVTTTCPHTGPSEDGALVTTQEPCVLCEAVDGGSEQADGSSDSDAKVEEKTPSSSSSGGCSASPASPSSSGLGLVLAAAVVAGSLQRRRRAV